MPRKKKQPVAIADTLDEVIAKAGLKPASELPAQLSPPELELKPLPRSEAEPPPRELIETSPDVARPRPSHRLNGEERPTFVERVRKPAFSPVPEGFKNVLRHETAGIRVNKGIDRETMGAASIQFAEDRPLSRATEYDLMEQVQEAGFSYKPANRQWERPRQEGAPLGDNVIDAVRIAKEIAEERGGERGR